MRKRLPPSSTNSPSKVRPYAARATDERNELNDAPSTAMLTTNSQTRSAFMGTPPSRGKGRKAYATEARSAYRSQAPFRIVQLLQTCSHYNTVQAAAFVGHRLAFPLCSRYKAPSKMSEDGAGPLAPVQRRLLVLALAAVLAALAYAFPLPNVPET